MPRGAKKISSSGLSVESSDVCPNQVPGCCPYSAPPSAESENMEVADVVTESKNMEVATEHVAQEANKYCTADVASEHAVVEDGNCTADIAPVESVSEAQDLGPKKKRARKNKKGEVDDASTKTRKPKNAYMLFYCDELKKDQYANVPLPERARTIGAIWRSMDDAAREPFKNRAEQSKA